MRDIQKRLVDSFGGNYLSSDYVRSLLKSPEFKNCLPHHRQKKSLGFRSVASLSDAEKIRLLMFGQCLLGSDRLSLPPLYIQNKLMFSPCYFVDSSGERIVKREATQFFIDHFEQIMTKKVAYFEQLFQSMKDSQFFDSCGIGEHFESSELSEFVKSWDDYGVFGCSIAEAWVYYYGIPHKMAFVDKKASYLNRYLVPVCGSWNDFLDGYDLITPRQWYNIQRFFNYLMPCMKWKTRSVRDEKADFVRDEFNLSA